MKENYQKFNSAFERTVHDLCNQIDELMLENEYLRERVLELENENNKILNERLATAQKGVADALRLAFSLKENDNGDLIIKKSDRESLANSYNEKN